MAQYHLNVQPISRGKGRNAVACAAYRRAGKFYDEQCHRTWNYLNKPGVIHSEITLPEDAPAWAKKTTSEYLWNLVEKTADRSNSRLAREARFALPVELTQEQSIILAREFIKDQFANLGMLADWSIHWDDPANPHVHAMLTTRELIGDGLGNPVRDWDKTSRLHIWREKWAEYANFHLKLHQHNVRIDHRSYKDRGIDLIPTIHRGYASDEMTRRGKSAERQNRIEEIKKINLKNILKNPELLAKKIFQCIEHHESVFSEQDLAKAVLTYASNKTEFDSAIENLKKSKGLIYLGQGEDGCERYTTRRMFDIENSLQSITEKLQKRNHIRISERKINKALEKYQAKIGKRLTPEQRNAVNHMVSPTSIACVIGKAGTGKSFTLGAANAIWKAKGLNVYGIALAGVAARNLQKEAGIQSRTIESFRFCVENGIITLTPRDVIVMDEAGMTDCIAMESVLKAVCKTKAKLALVGDHAQLQPVGPGSAFRALLERLHLKHENLQHVYRQNHEWQRIATAEFSKGYTREAIDRYYNNGFISLMSNDQAAKQKLVNDWHKDCLVLAHRNKDVNELNILIRQKRIHQKEIVEGYAVNSSRGVINISQGDRILFRINDKELGVSNGHFGEIKSVNFNESGKVVSFTVVLDDDQSREITVDPRFYQDFTYGYAATVHKSQGATIEHSLVYMGGRYWNQSLTYVAMSRHKESCHVYVDRNTHKNIEVLKNNVSRTPRKDSVLDYPLSFSERRGMCNESLFKRLPGYVAEKIKQVREKITAKFTQFTQLEIAVKSEIQVEIKKPESLTDILKRYVKYELKQAELVNLSHFSRRESLEESRNYSVLATKNNNEMEKFAKEVIHHPAIQSELENIKNSRVPKIYEVGGFKAMQSRLNEKRINQQDIDILIYQLKAKSVSWKQVMTQTQELKRGREL